MILNTLCQITGGEATDENDEHKSGSRIWDGDIVDYLKNDVAALQALLQAEDKLILSGPLVLTN